jgi:SAM-dependent methyltransferase
VILAALGAKVIAIDISDESLRRTGERARVNKVDANLTLLHSDAAVIPIPDQSADMVLCAAILHHVDCVATAQQIRRVLKPGGRAAFLEPLMGPTILSKVKNLMPRNASVSEDETPLTPEQIAAVSSTIGVRGRHRKFGLTMRAVTRIGTRSWPLIKASHRFDAFILDTLPFLGAFASPLVWESIRKD